MAFTEQFKGYIPYNCIFQMGIPQFLVHFSRFRTAWIKICWNKERTKFRL